MYKSDFIQQVQGLDLIDETVLAHLSRGDAGFYNQISLWAREGLLERLSKGRYILSRKLHGKKISNEALAVRIVPESYVSGISVLAQEQMIPEAYMGFVVVCMSPRKTRRFESAVGRFQYHHIKTRVYQGYSVAHDEFNKPYKRATPTKALLDHLYLNTAGVTPAESYLEDGLRLQKTEKISIEELRSYMGAYSRRMDQWIAAIESFKQQTEEG